MCPGIFVQGPESHLLRHQLAFHCPVHPSSAAILDSTLRVMVNHDIYYFSSAAARRAFEKNPLRYAHTLTDPVTKARFAPTGRSPRTTYHGRRYYFATTDTRAEFLARPDSFAVRRGG